MTQSPSRIADRVEEVRDEVRRNPVQAQDQARRAKAWFDANWSLETKIKDTILPFVEEVARVGRFARAREAGPVAAGRFGFRLSPAKAAPRGPQCEVVMRSGGRDLTYVERAVGAVKAANSPDFPLGMVVVDYRGRPDLQALCAALAGPDFPIRYIRSEGTGFRSTALWDGLKAVTAPFTAHLDDDDSVFENHYRHLSTAFERNPEVNICYSGVIRVEDEPGYYVSAPNYDGPLGKVIEERRELKFLDSFDLERMARFDNYIQSNAWMGRTAFVQSVIGDDPELLVVEDVYLYMLMAAHGAFGFTGSPTALWHWRSKSSDNSMLAVDQQAWQKCVDRVRLRLANVPFKSTTTFARLLSPAVASEEDGASRRKPSGPPALTFNEPIEGGMAFKANTILTGFHEPETPGIWSNEPNATVLMPLGDKVREEGGVLVVECLGSFDGSAERWLELGIADGATRRVEITDWSVKTVELPLPAGTASPIVLRLTSSHMIVPDGGGAETRALGGFIQSIRVVAETDSGASLFRVAGLGLPGPWSVPVGGGLARGALGTRKRVAVRARASTGGRLFLGDGETSLHVASSEDGDFLIPGRLAEASQWFVFAPTDGDAVGELHLEFTDAVGDTPWLTLSVDAVASLRDHRSLNEGSYQHAAASMTGTLLVDRGATPIYFLIQDQDGEGWWEIRPSYGAAWDILFDLGKPSTDEHGPYRRGPLKASAAFGLNANGVTGGANAGSRELVAASIMRSVLVGAVSALAEGRSEVPRDFLIWLIDTLMVPAATSERVRETVTV